ncbi:MAG: ROK family protein, partial [Acidimicrobiia bacterium]|nr:ROK family protein [Acidimicrobiia bacterium]
MGGVRIRRRSRGHGAAAGRVLPPRLRWLPRHVDLGSRLRAQRAPAGQGRHAAGGAVVQGRRPARCHGLDPVAAQGASAARGRGLSPSDAVALAVDIGGTKLEVGIVDRSGAIVARRRADTPSGADGEALFASLAALIVDVRLGVASEPVVCGVGTGGPMTAGGVTVSPLNIPAWRSFALRDRLRDLTDLPTFVDNDAKALALGEGWVGAARGRRDFLGMVVSTGIGGGIVLDGRLLDGADGNAGHIGHMCVEPDGRPCVCG